MGCPRVQAAPEILKGKDKRVLSLTPQRGARLEVPERGERELSASLLPHPSSLCFGPLSWIHRIPTAGPSCPRATTRPEPCVSAAVPATRSQRGPRPSARCTPTRAQERLCVCRNEGLFCQSQGHARDTRSLLPAAPRGRSGLPAPSGPPPAGPCLCSAY